MDHYQAVAQWITTWWDGWMGTTPNLASACSEQELPPQVLFHAPCPPLRLPRLNGVVRYSVTGSVPIGLLHTSQLDSSPSRRHLLVGPPSNEARFRCADYRGGEELFASISRIIEGRWGGEPASISLAHWFQ